MGGGTIKIKAEKLKGIQLQGSAYGLPVAVTFGLSRVAGNVLWTDGFTAIAHTKKKKSGGSAGIGGTTTKTTTYTYTAHVAIALGEGQIFGLPRVWRGKEQFVGGIASSQFGKTSESYAVPAGGGSKTVTQASGWRCTVRVYYTGPLDVGDGTTTGPIHLAEGTDYTVDAGVYSFGAAWAGKTLWIEYQYVTGSLTQAGLAKLGLSMFGGAIGQASWSLLSSNFTAAAVPYSGLAYVAGQDYDLESDASLPNHNFEVQGRLAYHLGSSTPDADPAIVTLQMLTDARFGALFPAGRLNIALWSTYCRAAGLILSPAFTDQVQSSELVRKMAEITNSAPVWSAGKLKVVPYGDQVLTANGATFTPNVTPIYDLDDDSLLPIGPNGEPILTTPKPSRDAKNHFRVEFLDRANDYNVSIAEAKDQADIDTFGLRSADVYEAHWITDRAVATRVAQLLLARSLYIRTEYRFRLPWTFALLEPMDLVTLTDSYLGFDKLAVRITSIDESDDGQLDLTAEEFPAGVATASLYGFQDGAGTSVDYNAAPGAVSAPFFFEAPGERSVTGLEVYAAVYGTGAEWGGCTVWVSLDGSNYENAGRHYGGSRIGTLTSAIAAGVFGVQFENGETMDSVSAADAAVLNSLCYIAGASPEYLAWQTATLTGASAYTLGGLARGAYGTDGGVAHAIGDRFVIVDDAVTKSGPLELAMIGKTIYFKFTSFNRYGLGEQDLADVPAYTYTITGNMAAIGAGRAKLVTLNATGQAFTFDSSGNAAPTGQSISFTALLQKTVAATATWSTVPAGITLGGSGNTRTLAIAAFGANSSVKVRASADGLYDEITVVRLQDGLDGSPGASAIQAILSNETAALPADSSGAVSSYAGSATQLRVYEGSTLLDFVTTTPGNGQWTATRAGTSITPGAISSTGTTPNRYASVAAHSAMTADAAYVDFSITGKTVAGVAFSTTKRQALSKSKGGVSALTPAATLLNFTVQCDYAGVPASGAFTNAVGQFNVLSGSTDVTANCTFSAVFTNCTGSINTAINTPVTGAKGSYRVTAMAADSAYVDLTATYLGSSVTQRFVLSKVYAGTPATSKTTTVSVTNSGTYATVAGPFTLPVGPTGTVTASINRAYQETAGIASRMDAKLQYRTTPGSGSWVDIGTAITGTDSTNGEGPGSVNGSRTTPGPASAANWEFQAVALKSGGGTLTTFGSSSSFSVSWG